ncbi:exopolysaccharide biosynthesis polyprenyl glycosylphosphotransferase [Terrihabitans sp. B22-R8]|uniref:exopolysaccharide biosynthesis polyprenyl glycosylphosphotransferase n=1 Tax=Terrihabitans sp. B22-R8 TaxID=3425128 RepID=UPI00403C92DB
MISRTAGLTAAADHQNDSTSFIFHRHTAKFLASVVFLLIDILSIASGAIAGAFLRQGTLEDGNWVQFIGVVLPAYLIACAFLGGYSGAVLSRFSSSFPRSVLALAISLGIGFCAAFALQVGSQLSRLETAYSIMVALLLLLVLRGIGQKILRPVFELSREERVTIISDGADGPTASLFPRARIVAVRPGAAMAGGNDPAFFHDVGALACGADRVVLMIHDPQDRLLWANAMRLCGIDAEVVADLGALKPIGISEWGGQSTLVVSRGPLGLSERIVKRAFDVALSLLLLPPAALVIGLAALLVKLESPGPALFVQMRVGLNNRHYRCYKLRTMRHDMADETGLQSASPSDERTTRTGRFLRKMSLDELPQLVNVLRGDMSLVGPRPHALGSRAEGAFFWEVLPDYWTRHAIRPGLTGLAQVRGLRGATHTRTDIERRVAADLEYINGWSLWLDIKILFRTLAVIVHKNAY